MKILKLLFEQEQPFSPELFDALKDFVSNNKTEKLQSKIPEIEKLIASHEYENITNPGGVKVYRGMKLTFEEAEALCQGKNCTEEQGKNGVVYRTFKGAGELPSKRIVQSWSENPSVGLQFAIDPEVGGEIPVVFATTATQGKFFGKPGELGKIVNPERASEMETISIGKVGYEGFAMGIPAESWLGRDPHSVDITKLKSLILSL